MLAASSAACAVAAAAEDGTTTLNTTATVPLPSDENFLCGQFAAECEKVASIPGGPSLWSKKHFSYRGDGTYSHRERGFFNRTACENDLPWLQLEYEGTWSSAGVTQAGEERLSLASIDVTSVWMDLWQAEACLEQVDGGVRCLQTVTAIRELCPCNGWDWAPELNSTESRRRNIGMFCMPAEQCPIVHQVYHQQVHYVSYTAAAGRVCIKDVHTDPKISWERLGKEARCYQKVEPGMCRGALSGAAAVGPGGLALIASGFMTWAASRS